MDFKYLATSRAKNHTITAAMALHQKQIFHKIFWTAFDAAFDGNVFAGVILVVIAVELF